jgi:hypothetical protein
MSHTRTQRARYPEKYRAWNLAQAALRAGRIVKGPCEVCGTREDVQKHHDDYSRPLEIRWLCRAHHAEHHNRERAA